MQMVVGVRTCRAGQRYGRRHAGLSGTRAGRPPPPGAGLRHRHSERPFGDEGLAVVPQPHEDAVRLELGGRSGCGAGCRPAREGSVP